MNLADIIACGLIATLFAAGVALAVVANRRWWALSADDRKRFRADIHVPGDW